DFVRAAVTAGRTDNGVFGARIMWGTMDHMTARLRRALGDAGASDLELLYRCFGRTRFLSLRRADTLAQAVSWTRAEQTNRWQDEEPVPPTREPHFDVEAIERSVTTIEEHESAWRQWFAMCEVRPFEVLYEDLIADMTGVVGAIFQFLGLRLPTDRPITPGHRRQADGINDDWIRRYRALRE
ncbi:MAG TPA: Stf0 family sulfotransferase, partial [Acidimicrobiales bacterium]|nr:Stf0 family sulfotransferase [Acidimicrobiales bacterium]